MKDIGSKIIICNDIMDENFYIKGIIYIMLCYVYKLKFVMIFLFFLICFYNLYIYMYYIFFQLKLLFNSVELFIKVNDGCCMNVKKKL